MAEEESDSVTETDDGFVIEGQVYAAYSDEFHLAQDATLEMAAFDGNCTLSIDGEPVQLGPLVSTAVSEGFSL